MKTIIPDHIYELIDTLVERLLDIRNAEDEDAPPDIIESKRLSARMVRYELDVELIRLGG